MSLSEDVLCIFIEVTQKLGHWGRVENSWSTPELFESPVLQGCFKLSQVERRLERCLDDVESQLELEAGFRKRKWEMINQGNWQGILEVMSCLLVSYACDIGPLALKM